MCNEFHEHLREVIQDHWGLSMREIEEVTGFPRPMLRDALTSMEAANQIQRKEGRYVARCP